MLAFLRVGPLPPRVFAANVLVFSLSMLLGAVGAAGLPSGGDVPAVSVEAKEFRATGGHCAKVADVLNKKLTTVSGQRCGWTELYMSETSTLGHILDFFIGG